MAKKVVKKISKEIKFDTSIVAYIFGILAIVQAFFLPLSGIVLGILGLVFSKMEKTPLALKAKKLSIIGLVIGAVFALVQIGLTMFSYLGQASGAI